MMNRHRSFAVLMACSLTLLFALTGCGVFGGDAKENPSSTATSADDSVRPAEPALTVVGSRFSDFADRVEALGRSYLTPTTIEYFIGTPPEQFQTEYQFSVVCGQEIAMAHPGLSLDRTLAEQVLLNGLTEEEIRALPPEASYVGSDVYLGKERVALEKSLAIRVDGLFIVSKVPDALTLTHAQRECDFEREKFYNLRLYEDVYFIGGNGVGNKGFIATANLKNSEDIFPVAVPVNNTLPGELVVVDRGGRPKILGMALEFLPANPGFILVVGIDSLFPPK